MFFGGLFAFLLSKYISMELLGHVVNVCLTLKETAQRFSEAVGNKYI